MGVASGGRVASGVGVASRPHWMTALAVFCLLTVAFLVPRDLFSAETRDVELWLGFELRGRAAQLTAPLHWAIFAVGAWGFWRAKPWIVPDGSLAGTLKRVLRELPRDHRVDARALDKLHRLRRHGYGRVDDWPVEPGTEQRAEGGHQLVGRLAGRRGGHDHDLSCAEPTHLGGNLVPCPRSDEDPYGMCLMHADVRHLAAPSSQVAV